MRAGDQTARSPAIKRNPAAATGLTDRGAIAEGLRADVAVVDPAIPRVVATIVGGRIAHLTAEGAARLSAVIAA